MEIFASETDSRPAEKGIAPPQKPSIQSPRKALKRSKYRPWSIQRPIGFTHLGRAAFYWMLLPAWTFKIQVLGPSIVTRSLLHSARNTIGTIPFLLNSCPTSLGA